MTSNSSRVDLIRTRIQAALDPEIVEVTDDSHLHAGHAGAQGGAGHYSVNIIANRFNGLNTVARHRLIYDALGDLIPGQIHALSIRAATPEEK